MKKNEISTGKWLIKEVFENWYKIPEYQRPYVWESDQVNDLLEDIQQALLFNKDAEYFLGSIVLQKKIIKSADDKEYTEYDLLDGQQRLTTLFLMTAVIRDLCINENIKIKCQTDVFRQADPLDQIPERVRINFEHRDDVQYFISKFIKTHGGTQNKTELYSLGRSCTDVSIKNMINSLRVMSDHFAAISEEEITKFYTFLRNNVLLIHVSSEKLDDAFRLFTVLNDRGLKLRHSDILKAENLREIKEDIVRKRCAQTWEAIEEYFEEDFDTFLSHIRTILVKDKARTNLLEEFNDRIYYPKDFNQQTKQYTQMKPLLNKGQETIDLFKRHYENCEAIFGKNNSKITKNYEYQNLLELMQTAIPADYWQASLLFYFDKFKEVGLYEFLKLLDNKISGDWITAQTPTQRLENNNAILKVIDEAKSFMDVLSHKKIFSVDTETFKNVINEDVYRRKFARYLLFKLDLIFLGSNKQLVTTATMSVEHILPQNPSDTSQWKKDFTDDERENWTDKLGNLVLISKRKNSSQGRLDFKDKKDKYLQKNIETFSNSIRVITKNDQWTPVTLQNNQVAVVGSLLEYYNYKL